MEPEEYDKMRRMEDTYWWYVGKRALVWALLEDRVPRGAAYLDLGCGTGAMSQELAGRGSVVSLDYEFVALDHARGRGLDRLVRGSAEALPFRNDSFDALTALDVVEHLDDDAAAIREIARVLRPGGTAVVTVPAFAFLWTEHDVALHHRRRYQVGEFRTLFRQAGLTVERLSYEMTALFPAVAAFRLAKKALGSGRKTVAEARTTLPEFPGPLNGALTGLLRAEAALVKRVDLPFGVSLVCVARKGGSASGPQDARARERRTR